MKYWIWKEYNGLNFIGQKITIPAGEYLEVQDIYICWNRIPVCVTTSQVAKDYFIWAGDGNEYRRAEYERVVWFDRPIKARVEKIPVYDQDGQVIKFIDQTVVSKYSMGETLFLKQNYSRYLVNSDDVILFNDDFYTMPIDILEKLAGYFRSHDNQED